MTASRDFIGLLLAIIHKFSTVSDSGHGYLLPAHELVLVHIFSSPVFCYSPRWASSHGVSDTRIGAVSPMSPPLSCPLSCRRCPVRCPVVAVRSSLSCPLSGRRCPRRCPAAAVRSSLYCPLSGRRCTVRCPAAGVQSLSGRRCPAAGVPRRSALSVCRYEPRCLMERPTDGRASIITIGPISYGQR